MATKKLPAARTLESLKTGVLPTTVASVARSAPQGARGGGKAVTVYLPVAVAKAAREKAHADGTTLRTVILQGLKAIGLPVPADELADLRQRKRKA